MQSSYAAWEKYNVDKELEALEICEAEEIKHKEEKKYMRERDQTVNNIATDAGDNAQILATKAAIAALKAKKKKQQDKTEQIEKELNEAPLDYVELLNKRAQLLQVKSESIQETMQHRQFGDKSMGISAYDDALKSYQKALESLNRLQSVIPQLGELEREQLDQMEKPSPIPVKQSTDATQQCHNAQGNHEHHHEHAREEKPAPKLRPIPKSSDLQGIAQMLHIDCSMGIGKCEYELGHYAAASEAFKDVILKDSNHIKAWSSRGDSFKAMGNTFDMGKLIFYNIINW